MMKTKYMKSGDFYFFRLLFLWILKFSFWRNFASKKNGDIISKINLGWNIWIWVHEGNTWHLNLSWMQHMSFDAHTLQCHFCIKICMTKYKYISIISLYMAKRLSFKTKTNYIKYHYNLNAHAFLKGMYNFPFVGFKLSL
jgi:hypothetical protein